MTYNAENSMNPALPGNDLKKYMSNSAKGKTGLKAKMKGRAG